MRILAGMLWLFLCAFAWAEEASIDLKGTSQGDLFEKSYKLFSEGKYQATADELESVRVVLDERKNPNSSLRGLISYWKGICFSRLQKFPEALTSFAEALALNYEPKDIHYEYGQALFASEKLPEARLQFRESLRKKFKRGVSLYYIAYISKEMGEKKKAVTFYKAIHKLPPEEVKEVVQASEFQIGDIYLEQAEAHPNAFSSVENYVIPQYKKALAINEHSALGLEIAHKIKTLQQKYELILFKMRNGRPTLVPPYFFKASQEIGFDSNVTFAPQETTIAQSKQSSLYSRTDAIGRYTFYHQDIISIAPELRFNFTRYARRIKEIYRNDNYLLAPAVRSAYEHKLFNKPASLLFDYDFSYTERDLNAQQELVFSGRSHTFMVGERFNYFPSGESIVRLRHRTFESYNPTSDSKTLSLVFEQIFQLKENTLIFMSSYDRTRVVNELFDTDGVTVRGDMIFPRYKDWFTPSVGLGLTTTNPINNKEERGRELLINPNARLSKTIGKHWRTNLKADYQKNNSKDESNFAFKKYTVAVDLEYLF